MAKIEAQSLGSKPCPKWGQKGPDFKRDVLKSIRRAQVSKLTWLVLGWCPAGRSLGNRRVEQFIWLPLARAGLRAKNCARRSPFTSNYGCGGVFAPSCRRIVQIRLFSRYYGAFK